jgi:cytochrome b translational activator protein CBS2
MGLDLKGRYIAHTLAGCESIPPVRYIIHTHPMYKLWCQAGKQLVMHRGDISITRRRIHGQYIPADATESPRDRVIDNLIVTLPASQVVKALGHIKHRLDHRSTICLVNDGLGVAEALIEAYFPDESRRPIFLLGHLTTALDYAHSRFSLAEVRQGRLYLTLFSTPRDAELPFQIKRHPPLERTARAMHLIRLLTAMPGLRATGHSMPEFLRYKLPSVAFRTIVDPLAALLDCQYHKLPNNPYARQLMDQLIGELSRLLSRLPECKDSARFRQAALAGSLRDEVLHKLMLQRTADSRMRALVARGVDTDVDYLAGYFVRRGREVNASVTALDSVLCAVKAKQAEVLKALNAEIPFETAESGREPPAL